MVVYVPLLRGLHSFQHQCPEGVTCVVCTPVYLPSTGENDPHWQTVSALYFVTVTCYHKYLIY